MRYLSKSCPLQYLVYDFAMRALIVALVTTFVLLFGSFHAEAQARGASAGRYVTVPAEGGLIFQMKVNGQGPYRTVFNTGAVNIISAAFARQLGLHIEEKTVDFGAIGGSVQARTVHVDTLTVGELNIKDEIFYVLDIPSEAGTPQMLLGWEFMQMFAVEMNPKRSEITFFEGTHFRYAGKGKAVPIFLHTTATVSMWMRKSARSRAAFFWIPGISSEPF